MREKQSSDIFRFVFGLYTGWGGDGDRESTEHVTQHPGLGF